MGGELTKLSETRWRYATGKRVYYVRRVRAPDEDRHLPGTYRVDTGGGEVCVMLASSVEQVAEFLRDSPSPDPQSYPIPW